jgi:hypothetical protein
MRELTPAEQQLADKLTDAGPTQADAEEWVVAVVDGTEDDPRPTDIYSPEYDEWFKRHYDVTQEVKE